MNARPPDPAAAAARPERLLAPDAARGVALLAMVFVHASTFAKVNIMSVRFAQRHIPLPGPGWLETGIVAYLAPVLFWFLLGVSAALLGSRRADAAAVDRFLLVRVAILIALDQTLLEWLWDPMRPFHLDPTFELLTMLALAMALLVPLRRAPDALVASLAGVLALSYPWVVRHFTQAQLEAAPLALRPLVTYDFVHVPTSTFPLAGWFVLPLLGLLAGRRLQRPAWRTPRPWLVSALACFAVWAAAQLTGWGDYAPQGGLHLALMSDGPPGLDFMAWHLGVSGLLMAAFCSPAMPWRAPWARLLVNIGRAALFAYVVHLAVIFLVSRPLLHVLRHADALRYVCTVAGAIAILAVLVDGWLRLKARHPRSVLRFL